MKPPRWRRTPGQSKVTLTIDHASGEPVRLIVFRSGRRWTYWVEILAWVYAPIDWKGEPFPRRRDAEVAALDYMVALTGRTYRAALALRKGT
jgi:hypothetical protein